MNRAIPLTVGSRRPWRRSRRAWTRPGQRSRRRGTSFRCTMAAPMGPTSTRSRPSMAATPPTWPGCTRARSTSWRRSGSCRGSPISRGCPRSWSCPGVPRLGRACRPARSAMREAVAADISRSPAASRWMPCSAAARPMRSRVSADSTGWGACYRTSARSDRMGVRLEGPPVAGGGGDGLSVAVLPRPRATATRWAADHPPRRRPDDRRVSRDRPRDYGRPAARGAVAAGRGRHLPADDARRGPCRVSLARESAGGGPRRGRCARLNPSRNEIPCTSTSIATSAKGAATTRRSCRSCRRRTSPAAAAELVLGQIARLATVTGDGLHHVKLHGALYHQVESDAGLAAAIAGALAVAHPRLVV
jgi:hypothetical protein